MITAGIFLLLVILIAVPYWLRAHRRHRRTGQAIKAGRGHDEPATLHPKIDILTCIGCGSCVRICPEQVLGIVDGHAAIIHGSRCVGHAVCESTCPVTAITMGFGTPKQGMEIPMYDEQYETNIPGLFIAGELGGIGLIRNAIRQGVTAIDTIADRVTGSDIHDVVIVGAGPAGMAAALQATARKLRYSILEQDALGGSILHYPRKKLVLTQPVDLPLYGRIRGPEISKEELMSLFQEVRDRYAIDVRESRKVQTIRSLGDRFIVETGSEIYPAKTVVLAMGRRGTPNKLGVPGEEHPKVAYKLIEAEQYQRRNVLVVGGGDSAIEAVVALAAQEGTNVTLSYRKKEFVRLKEKNEKRIGALIKEGRVNILFESNVSSIGESNVAIAQANGSTMTLPNDAVFIFAGGVLPTPFLRQCGIRLREAEVETGSAAVATG